MEIDEKPVGQGQSSNAFEGSTSVVEDFSKVDTAKLLVHPNWKARKEGYDRVAKDPARWRSLLLENVAKVSTESNAAAQEALFEALVQVLPHCEPDELNVLCGAPFSLMIEKGLTGRPKAVELSQRFAFLAVESGKPKEVMDPLVASFTSKAPKCRIGAAELCSKLVNDFGTQHFPMKEILKAMQPLFNDVNPQVRKEAQNLCCKCYQYLGASIKGFLTDLRDVQLQELEKQFEKVTLGAAPPKQINGYEDVAPQSRKASAVPLTGLTAGGDNADIDDDAFELLDETPIVPKLPKNFFKVTLDKSLPWQERCELVNTRALNLMATAPRFRQSDDYHELASMMKQYLMDPQAPLMLLGFRMIQECARGLRAHFAPLAKMYIAPLFEKMKDKKTSVLEHIKHTLEKLIHYHCITFDQCLEEVDAVTRGKNAPQRLATLKFCDYMLPKLDRSQYPKFANANGTLKRMVNDEKPENRDVAYSVLTHLMNEFGESTYSSVLASLDDKQRAKLNAVSSKPSSRFASALPTPKESAITPSLSPAKKVPCEEDVDGRPRPRASSTRLRSRTGSRLDPNRGSHSARGSAAHLSHPPTRGGEDGISLLSTLPSKVEASNTVLGLMNGEESILDLLRSKEWNRRNDGVAKIKAVTDTWTPSQCRANFTVLLTFLKTTPGLSAESTFQVFQSVLLLLQDILNRCSEVSPAAAYVLVAECTHKLTEPKNTKPCRDVINDVAERMGIRFVVKHITKEAGQVKTPKLLIETNEVVLELLSRPVDPAAPDTKDQVEVKPLQSYLKICLEQNSIPLRNSSIQILLLLRQRAGGPIVDTFVATLSAPIRTHYDAELQKLGETNTSEQLPPQHPAPRRNSTIRSGTPMSQKRTRPETGATRKASVNTARTASPRPSLAASTTTSLGGDVPLSLKKILKQISSEEDWRDRLEGVHQVSDYVDSVGGQLPASTVAPILKALGGRLGESNKNFVVDVLKQIVRVAQSGGAEESAAPFRSLLPSVFPYLGDQKVNLREEAREVVFMGVEIIGLENMLPLLKGPLNSESYVCRQNVLEAMCFGFEQLPPEVPINKTSLRLLVPSVVKALMDRIQEVRIAAENVVGFMLPIIGDEPFYTTVNGMKPADQQSVLPAIERQIQGVSNLPSGRPIENEESELHTPRRRGSTPRSPRAGGSPSPRSSGRRDPSALRSPPQPEPNPRGTKEVIHPSSPPPPPSKVEESDEENVGEERMYTMPEILSGLPSAPSDLALDMCDDFKEHFQKDKQCGSTELMQILIERLFEHTRHLEAELALSLIQCLQSMFVEPVCVKKCTSNIIYRFIGTLFDCLLSEQFSTNEPVIKALNKMILKFIEGASTNEMFHALISRLTSYSTTYIQTTRKSDFKYIQVTVKCILQIPLKNVSDENIVLCCHDFLLQHPPSAFKTVDDLSLRTIKTVLQNTTSLRGTSLLDTSLRLVGGPFLVTHFIRASLGQSPEDNTNKTAHEAHAEEESIQHQRASQSPPPRVVVKVKSTHADPASSHPAALAPSPRQISASPNRTNKVTLPSIFSRCRHQETTAAGFDELYAYLKSNPLQEYEEVFNAQLSRCSEAFQEHIRRKLEQKMSEDTSKPVGFTLPPSLVKK